MLEAAGEVAASGREAGADPGRPGPEGRRRRGRGAGRGIGPEGPLLGMGRAHGAARRPVDTQRSGEERGMKHMTQRTLRRTRRGSRGTRFHPWLALLALAGIVLPAATGAADEAVEVQRRPVTFQ